MEREVQKAWGFVSTLPVILNCSLRTYAGMTSTDWGEQEEESGDYLLFVGMRDGQGSLHSGGPEHLMTRVLAYSVYLLIILRSVGIMCLLNFLILFSSFYLLFGYPGNYCHFI